jgi:hypothetical protein
MTPNTEDVAAKTTETAELGGLIDFDSYLSDKAPTTFRMWGEVWTVRPVGQRSVRGSNPGEFGKARANVVRTQVAANLAKTGLIAAEKSLYVDAEQEASDAYTAAVEELATLAVDKPDRFRELATLNEGLPPGMATRILKVVIAGMDATRPFD